MNYTITIKEFFKKEVIDIYVCVFVCNGILLRHKKEQNNTICSKMDTARHYILSEVR